MSTVEIWAIVIAGFTCVLCGMLVGLVDRPGCGSFILLGLIAFGAWFSFHLLGVA